MYLQFYPQRLLWRCLSGPYVRSRLLSDCWFGLKHLLREKKYEKETDKEREIRENRQLWFGVVQYFGHLIHPAEIQMSLVIIKGKLSKSIFASTSSPNDSVAVSESYKMLPHSRAGRHQVTSESNIFFTSCLVDIWLSFLKAEYRIQHCFQ